MTGRTEIGVWEAYCKIGEKPPKLKPCHQSLECAVKCVCVHVDVYVCVYIYVYAYMYDNIK